MFTFWVKSGANFFRFGIILIIVMTIIVMVIIIMIIVQICD